MPYTIKLLPQTNQSSSAAKISQAREFLEQNLQAQADWLSHSFDWLTHGLTSLTLAIHYTPASAPEVLTTHISVTAATPAQETDLAATLTQFLRLSTLSDFYYIEPVTTAPPFASLNWVQCIGELFKPQQHVTIATQDYYRPYSFTPNPHNNMLALCDQLLRLGPEPCLITITLQPVPPNVHASSLEQAIRQKSAQLQAALKHHRDPFLTDALQHYQSIPNDYLRRNTFRYSIKALSQTATAARAVLRSLLQCATQPSTAPEPGHIEIVTAQSHPQIFQASLAATHNQAISEAIEWQGWQAGLAEKSIRPSLQNPMKSGLGDSSTKLPTPGSRLNNPLGRAAPQNSLQAFGNSPKSLTAGANPTNPSSSSLVPTGPSALSRRPPNNPTYQPAQVGDLKPLHCLVTPDEISSFFRLPIPVNGPIPGMGKPPAAACTVADLLSRYRHLITPDTYIIGTTATGQPILSDWASIPHRLLAGVPGSGKSNFLSWIIFQFLLANPNGHLYIADLKGATFDYLKQLNRDITIAEDVASCSEMLEQMQTQEYRHRIELAREYGAGNNFTNLREEVQSDGKDLARTLWIIDEAADIASAGKLGRQVEDQLSDYTRKGRSLGIHVLYCTQLPTKAIVTDQVLQQCEEKVVFRVSEEASLRLLGTSRAYKQPVGQCVVDTPDDQLTVITPEMVFPSRRRPLEDTIWQQLYRDPPPKPDPDPSESENPDTTNDTQDTP